MAYTFQTFSLGNVLTAAQMNQVEVNIRDHVHGQDGVAQVDLRAAPFVSAPQSIVAAGNQTLTLAHGLARAPRQVTGFLSCVGSDLNYNPGDMIEAPKLSSTARGFSWKVNSGDVTNVIIKIPSATPPFTIFNNSTNASADIAVASWRLIIQAW